MRFPKSILLTIPFLFLSIPATMAAQVANYEFQNSLASSDGSASSLVDLGTGSYVLDSVFGQECTVFDFAEQTGLSLDITGLFGSSEYSFVAVMRFSETYSYAKILDLENRIEDEGLYAYENGLIFYDYYNHGLSQLSNDVWAQVVLTYDGSVLRGYVDGVEAFAEDDTDNDGGIASSTLFFFRDDVDTSDGENSAGRVANLQLFNHVLSPQEVSALNFSCNNNDHDPIHSTPVPTVSVWGKIGMVFILMIAGLGFTRRVFK